MVAITVTGSKYLSAHVHVITVVFFRFGIATMLLLVFCLIQKDGLSIKHFTHLKKKEWILIACQGICAGVLFNSLVMLGLQYTDASVAGIIISVLPALIAAGAVVFLRERLSMPTVIALVMAIGGLIVINAQHLSLGTKGYLLGDFIVFIALLPEAAYFVLSRFYENRLPVFHLSLLMNGVNFLCLMPIAFISGFDYVLQFVNLNVFEVMLLTGIASSFFYVFWSMGAKVIPASRAGLFTAMGPLLIMIIAYLFLGEAISSIQLLGMLLVMTSIFVSSYSNR